MNLDWLGKLAPTVATALGSPLAGLAVDAISKALGVDSSQVEDTLAAGKMTGDQVLALKQAELALQQQEKELGFKFADLEVADRKDARAMQVAMHSNVPAILTIIVTLGFFGVLAGMLRGLLKADSNPVMLMMLGNLGAGWTAALAYWLGTTHGSAQKTDLLARAAPIE